jgi:hypothetical protein
VTNGLVNSSLLREANLDDGPQAVELLSSLGLAVPETPTDIAAHWKRLWVDNPALNTGKKNPPLGWVLEKDGQMVGFFCNLLLLYYYGDRPVIVADASQWALKKQHRAKILQLSNAFFNQEGVDLLIATTANASAGRIFERHEASRIPQSDYNQALYWILDGSGFAHAASKRKNLHPIVKSIVSASAGPIINFGLTVSRRKSSGIAHNIDFIDVDKIDEEFTKLWHRKRDESKKLLACRSAESLRWHFGGSHNNQATKFLVHHKEHLRGYMAVRREDALDIGLKRLRIADLIVEKDDASIVDGLLIAACDFGRQQGCHVLEWMGMPSNLRNIALKHRPFKRSMPTWPLFYKVVTAGFKDKLKNENNWYVTPYDGDTTLA